MKNNDEKPSQMEIYEAYTQKQMNDYRYKHTLGVVETAKDLAVIHGVDECKATLAALFHDLAKEFSATKKRRYCEGYEIVVDDFMSNNIHLTHGAIAAYMVEAEFEIEDEDILNAIYNHTLGSTNMSDLEKIIYIADIIEPNRKRAKKLDKLRRLAYTDLNQAMKFALERNVTYLNSKNREVHPVIYAIIEEYNHIDKEEVNDRISKI